MDNIKVAFFTEAGKTRGLGHLVRSQCIADYFCLKKYITTLYLDTDVDFSYLYEYENFYWKEIQKIKKQFDIIFIDSYEATIEDYQYFCKQAKLCVYIDDFERIEYPEGVIINFALDAQKRFFRQKYIKHHYLLGAKYLPIRHVFIEAKKNHLDGNYILIMLGGMDVSDLSIQIIENLKSIQVKKVFITANKRKVKELKHYHDVIVCVRPDEQTLVNIMAKATLAISTASMSLYELSFLQIPSIAIAVAENQTDSIKQFLKYGLCQYFIDILQNHWSIQLIENINKILSNCKKPTSQIDAKGVQRIEVQLRNLLK